MRPYLPYLTTAVKAATRVKYVLWIGEKQGLGNGSRETFTSLDQFDLRNRTRSTGWTLIMTGLIPTPLLKRSSSEGSMFSCLSPPSSKRVSSAILSGVRSIPPGAVTGTAWSFAPGNTAVTFFLYIPSVIHSRSGDATSLSNVIKCPPGIRNAAVFSAALFKDSSL